MSHTTEFIKRLMEVKGLDQGGFSEASGIYPTRVSMLLGGKEPFGFKAINQIMNNMDLAEPTRAELAACYLRDHLEDRLDVRAELVTIDAIASDSERVRELVRAIRRHADNALLLEIIEEPIRLVDRSFKPTAGG